MKPLILLAWEHGSGRGHLSRLLCCAEMIVKRGGQPVFAVPPVHMRDTELTKYGKVIATPVVSQALIHKNRLKYVNSFADILNNVGFSNEDALLPMLTHWINIFNAVKPDHIVLDYAPSAGLAAQLVGIEGTNLSSGFGVPPPECPVFPVNKLTSEVLYDNEKMITKISETIDKLSIKLVGKSGPTLAESIGAHKTLLTTIPEVDPYVRDLSISTYVGHMSNHTLFDPVAWPKEDETTAKAFVYVSDVGHVKPWLDTMLEANISVLCYSPVCDKKIVEQFTNTSVLISRKPFNLDTVLSQANFCINQGSATVVCQTLLAGKSQLMIPADTEKDMIATRVSSIGVGIKDDGDVYERIKAQIDTLLADTAMKHTAQSIASVYPQELLNSRVENLASMLVPD